LNIEIPICLRYYIFDASEIVIGMKLDFKN